MDKPDIGPRQVVYQNPFLRICQVEARFAGFRKTFFVTETGPRTGVLLIKDDKILLIRLYRLLVDGLAWEIPGGKVDDGETPETAAARECLEETCLRCLDLKPLLFFHPGLDTCDNPTHLFYATRFEPVPAQELDREEVTDTAWLPLSRCVEMIFKGEILDAMTINAILAYHVRQLRHEV